MGKERPIISGVINPRTKENEHFQNKVLRPIIKMQHLILMRVLITHAKKRKIDFSILNENKIKDHIKTILTKDIAFRNYILGIITGHLSISEYDSYALKSSEYNKRIIQMCNERFQKGISELL